MRDSGIKLLLISDIHCLGNVKIAFNSITGDTRPTRQVLQILDRALSRNWGKIDFALISGDITDTGNDSQYAAALTVLSNYDPERIAVIPGNHDLSNINSMQSWNWKMRKFKKYMKDYLPSFPMPVSSDEYFPYIRRLKEGFVIIGMDSTLRQTAKGYMEPRQLRRLAETLDSLEYATDHKIVMLHHDVSGDTKSFSGFHVKYGNVMKNRDEFLNALREHAAKTGRRDTTVISGHTHVKRIDMELVNNVNFVCAPSLGGVYEEDYMMIEINADGTLTEIPVEETESPKLRLLERIRAFVDSSPALKQLLQK